jgi:hypothetical protein
MASAPATTEEDHKIVEHDFPQLAELEDSVQTQDSTESEGSEYWTARGSLTTERQLSPTPSHASSAQQSDSTDSSDGGVLLSVAFDEHSQPQSQPQPARLTFSSPPIVPHAEGPETDDVDSSEEDEREEGEGEEGEEWGEENEKEMASPRQASHADQLECVEQHQNDSTK